MLCFSVDYSAANGSPQHLNHHISASRTPTDLSPRLPHLDYTVHKDGANIELIKEINTAPRCYRDSLLPFDLQHHPHSPAHLNHLNPTDGTYRTLVTGHPEWLLVQKLVFPWHEDDFQWINALVAGCSVTLESLDAARNRSGAFFILPR